MGEGPYNLGDKSLWMATEEQEEGFRGQPPFTPRKIIVQ